MQGLDPPLTSERELNPGSVETILLALRQQLEFRHEWAARYFPEAFRDGAFDYEDVDALDAVQAQAVRQILIEKLAHAWRQARKPSNSFLEDPDVTKEWKLKIALYEEALRDLAALYELPLPAGL